jgi:hypothetical protein
MFTVISVNPCSRGDVRRNHGSCHSYAGAANLARIVKRAFPDRTALVLLPTRPEIPRSRG